MDLLDRILSTEKHASELAARFLDHGAKRLVIRGPSGTGKTALAQRVATKVADSVSVIWLRGDARREDEAFYPFRAALGSKEVARFIDKGAQLFEALTEGVPVANPIAKAIRSLVKQHDESVGANDASEVSRRFKSLLTSLRTAKVLVVADDIQFFDGASRALLASCIDMPIRGKEVSVLSVVNTEAATGDDKYLRKLLATIDTKDLGYCRKEDFGEVLRGFGLETTLPSQMAELLFDCCGGHLQVAKSIVGDFRGRPESQLEPGTRNDLFRVVIDRRLAEASRQMQAMTDLLEPAAVIGSTFTLAEIACLTEQRPASIHAILKTGEGAHFVEDEGDVLRFVHEVVRDYFAARALPRRVGLLEKFAECLRVLRPHDYFARCLALIDAERMAAASVAYCQGQLLEWRNGRFNAEYLPSPRLQRLVLDSDMRAFLSVMKEASEALLEGDFRLAIVALRSIGEGVDPVLRGERDYLLAEALLKDLGASSAREARALLDKYASLQDIEAELWCRIWLLRLLADGQLEDYGAAQKTDREIASFLQGRLSVDVDSRRQFYRLCAMSEMHDDAEVARRRIVRACEYYEDRLSNDGFVDMYEFFICLTNRSGNAITTGNFAEARKEAHRALSIVAQYPAIGFPSCWSPANNLLVGAALSGGMPAHDAADLVELLIERYPRSDDDVLLYSNLGGLRILAGRYQAGRQAFEAVDARIAATADIDPFYLYIHRSNHAVAMHLDGDDDAAALWRASAALLPRLNPAMRAALTRRHEAVSTLFEVATLGDGDAWRALFAAACAQHSGLDPRRFPCGVFLTDIQIWSGY